MSHKLTDAQKEEDRRTRIQHPHMIKSKAHWDWESGYGDMEVPPTVIPNPKSNHKHNPNSNHNPNPNPKPNIRT